MPVKVKKNARKSRTGKKSRDTSSRATNSSGTQKASRYSYCSLPPMQELVVPKGIGAARLSLIQTMAKKWVNGTVLHYYFFNKTTDGADVRFTDGSTEWRPWDTKDAEKNVVRQAFKAWTDLNIGIRFEEVSKRSEAEIRIGFMRGDGAWSNVGRDVLTQGSNNRTMNFGWDLTRDARELDTAIHEIGHTLGFPHEHQNPNAGIVWDEEAVYASLAKPTNKWDRDKTFHNIIRKISPDEIQGSNWDPNSIMHYPFEAGLIKQPAQYRNGLNPAGGISERDKTWVKHFYPPLDHSAAVPLKPFQSVPVDAAAGEQQNFVIKPDATRTYSLKTFGDADTVMVLFENDNGKPRYLTAHDDSGTEGNAEIKVKLLAGREYILRVRTVFTSGTTAVMMW